MEKLKIILFIVEIIVLLVIVILQIHSFRKTFKKINDFKRVFPEKPKLVPLNNPEEGDVKIPELELSEEIIEE